MNPTSTARASLLRPVLSVGVGFVLLSLTGAPAAKSMAGLEAAGLAPAQATALLHAAPVAIAMAGLAVALLLGRGRNRLTRSVILGVAGVIIGFLTAMCLDLFVGARPLLERVTGPLGETSALDVAGWSLAVMSLVCGGVMLLVAGFGSAAARVMNLDQTDPECTEVRPRERGTFFQSGAGLVGQGLYMSGVATAHQVGASASDAVRIGLVALVAAGLAAVAWSSIALWRGMDELMRRLVVESYAWSGLITTVGVLVWALLEAMGVVAPLSAYAALVCLIYVQFMASLFVAAAVGSSSTLARAGAR